MPSPFDQSTYQVRLDWGTAGLARLATADPKAPGFTLINTLAQDRAKVLLESGKDYF